jgi:hypothetical protein
MNELPRFRREEEHAVVTADFVEPLSYDEDEAVETPDIAG